MPEHAVYCIDHPRAGDLAGADHLAGWLLCSKKIESVELPEAPGSCSYGLSRPDVAAAWERYPNAGASGFRVELPAGSLAEGAGLDLVLAVAGGLGFRRRLRLRLDPSTNDVQHALVHEKNPIRGFSPDTLEDRLKASLAAKPGITFRLDIINKCNLRCVMCHYSDPEVFQRPVEKLTPEEFRNLFEDIAPAVRNVMLSCADEPLASNHFPDILSYVADEHPRVNIAFCTNAMLMNAKIRRLIVEKGVSDVYLSMDGVYKRTLESIRVGAKYERIVANILALRDLKRAAGSERPRLILNFVMMNSNVHEAPRFVEMASRLGVGLIDFRHLIPSEYLDDRQMHLAEHKGKYNYFRKQIVRAAKRHHVELSLPPAYHTAESFDPSGLPEVDLDEFEAVSPDRARGDVPLPGKRPKITSLRGTSAEIFSETFCEMPFSEIMIAGQERVKPCPFYKGELGRLSEGKTLSEIFYGPAFRRLRRNMLRPHGDAGCRGCPIKSKQLMENIAGYGNPREKLRRLLK